MNLIAIDVVVVVALAPWPKLVAVPLTILVALIVGLALATYRGEA